MGKTINFAILCALFLLLSVGVCESSDSEMLKKVLLSREDQVGSFQVEYSLSQRGIDSDRWNWENDQKHKLTCKDDVYNFSREFIHTTDGPIKKVYSNYDGIIVSFQTGDYAPDNKGAAGIVGWENHPEPQGAYISPWVTSFGAIDGKQLKKRFEDGRFYAWTSPEGFQVLTHVEKDERNRSDFYLDENLRLVKISKGIIPVPKYRQKFSHICSKHPEQDIFSASWTIEMNNFTEIQGIPIALKAIKK